jgi:hypothetical protein
LLAFIKIVQFSYLLILVCTAKFPQNGLANRKGPIFQTMKVSVCAGHKVLMVVDYNSALIVGDPQVTLGWQLSPHPIHYYYYYVNY